MIKLSPEAQSLFTEYERLMHAVQSGVAMEIERRGAEHPKHTRVGINSALVNSSALGELLISKGLITDVEYATAMRDGAQREKDRYERHLSELLGANITLG